MRTARPSRTTLLLMMEARCTIIMEPALELTACAKEIPHKTFLWLDLQIAISVLAVRDSGIFLYYNIYIGKFGLFRDEPILVAVEMRKEATEAEVGSAQIRPRVWGRGVDLPRFWPMIIQGYPSRYEEIQGGLGGTHGL